MLLTGATNAVTLALSANPSLATLSGTTTVKPVGGIASFPDISVDRSGTGYTLVASSAGLSAMSSAFDVVTPLAALAVSAGSDHTCAIAADGAAYCWGSNVSGEVGDGTMTSRTAPVRVTGGIAFAGVSTGYAQSCGLTAVGAAYCWGMNQSGKLGDGTFTDRASPVAVQSGTNVASISSGFFHGCSLGKAGAAYCWGSNNTGQLGNSVTLSHSYEPVPVAGGHTFTSLSTTNMHTCGTTTSRALYCWGSNNSGQLGNNATSIPATTPALVAGGLQIAAVSAGAHHTCALITTGATYCWGDNAGGKLGDGTTTQRATPVAVTGGITFVSVTAGGRHTCGLTGTGTYCWGKNSEGQVGDGSMLVRVTPAAVAGGLTFTVISAGHSHTCGRTPASAVYCWGLNASGQLGDGTAINRSVPVLVVQ